MAISSCTENLRRYSAIGFVGGPFNAGALENLSANSVISSNQIRFSRKVREAPRRRTKSSDASQSQAGHGSEGSLSFIFRDGVDGVFQYQSDPALDQLPA